jgi:Caspase domain
MHLDCDMKNYKGGIIMNPLTRNCIVLLLVLLLFPVITQGQSYQDELKGMEVIFEEHFDDNRNEWKQKIFDSTSYMILNGEYITKNKYKDSDLIYENTSIEIDYRKDFIIEVSISMIKGSTNKGQAIKWGYQSSPRNYQAFYISRDGQYRYNTMIDNMIQRDASINWTKSKHINKSYNSNKVTIVKTGNLLKFFINDHQVDSTNYVDVHGKYIAFKIGSECKVAFDDLIIYGSTSSEKMNLVDRPQQAYPPDLIIENLKFKEPSGNKALDGLESGEFTFDVVNYGRGDAFDLNINVTPISVSDNLTFTSNSVISGILKNDRKSVTIPISADIDVQTLAREFRIEFSEEYGFEPDPIVITFETQAFEPPDLRIEQVAIDDKKDIEGEGDSYGNGNSIIEAGESIEVSAYVQNFGLGEAENVIATIKLNSNDRNITSPDENRTFNLGNISGGDYKKVDFYFYTSRRYDSENIPISIELVEVKGKFGSDIDLSLKAGVRSPNVMEVNVNRIATADTKPDMRIIDGLINKSDVDLNIPTTGLDGKNTLAVIIGIERYKYAPSVDYAGNDAQIFYQYAKNVFGIPEPNIYFRMNEGATAGEFQKIFAEDGWIARRLKEDTDIIIYYSGHGAPDTKSQKAYLIPSDIDPNYASTGFSLEDMYSSLASMKAKSVTVFIDACFSGESRAEEMLIAGIRPIGISIEDPTIIVNNLAVVTASTGAQYSAAYPDKSHGLFTYYLLKALRGDACGGDKTLTIEELYDYVFTNVKEKAGYLDKEQTPAIFGGNKKKVLVKY